MFAEEGGEGRSEWRDAAGGGVTDQQGMARDTGGCIIMRRCIFVFITFTHKDSLTRCPTPQ